MKLNTFKPLVARAGCPCVSGCHRTGETPEPPGSRAPRSLHAFTIIEIALCLGIIGFALVAIIGALPTGLNVQKVNREQTIIGQDAMVWMDALRSGALGYNDLTNYVVAITNEWTIYSGNPPTVVGGGGVPQKSGVDWYTSGNSSEGNVALTNGATIIGLLSTPVWTVPFFNRGGGYQSNYMIAYVRSFSGAEVDKIPQDNSTVLADAFTYRMIVQNFPYASLDTNAFSMNNTATNGLTPAQMVARTNLAYEVMLLQTNTQDFRLYFRWPVLPNGQIANYGVATFRQMANGQMMQTTYPNTAQPLYFVQSSIYSELTNHSAFLPLP